MRETILPLLQYAFIAWCSVEAQGQLYLYLYMVWQLESMEVYCLKGKLCRMLHVDIFGNNMYSATYAANLEGVFCMQFQTDTHELCYLWLKSPLVPALPLCHMACVVILSFARTASIKLNHCVHVVDPDTGHPPCGVFWAELNKETRFRAVLGVNWNNFLFTWIVCGTKGTRTVICLIKYYKIFRAVLVVTDYTSMRI
jgi:hypothetical protein